ncbi:MAG: SDR family oxidoreductase [Deltaproteobacteria bacterium]|nr:SDR family oxidoreductase [Deltaproteobacteria bacterium]
MSDAGTLAGQVAIVTGSSSGIGEATAHRLAAAGAAVVVNSSSSVDAGEKVAAALPNAIYVQGSVAEEAACKHLIDATLARFGRLDILVNNAGTTQLIPHADLDAVTDEIFHTILNTNLLGTWYLTRAALPHLKQSPAGVVVNVTSVAGLRPTGSSIPYAVSKAAINHLTVLMAKVCGPVRINAVAPGLVATPWTKDWGGLHAPVAQNAPLGRSASAEDVADAIYGVVIAKYMTGEIVCVDGGLSLVS